jgi:hypothetical protein
MVGGVPVQAYKKHPGVWGEGAPRKPEQHWLAVGWPDSLVFGQYPEP